MSPASSERAPIRHLLVDLAGVVCRFDRDVRVQALASLANRTPDDVAGILYESGLSERFDRGEFSSAEICQMLRQEVGVSGSDADLARVWATAFEPDEDVLRLIDRVKPDVTRTLLTNNDALLRDFMPLVLPTVHARFGLPLFSSLLHAVKPSEEAFAGALSLLGASAAEAFFIDDSPANVDGAKRAAIAAVRFIDPHTLERDLDHAGLLASS